MAQLHSALFIRPYGYGILTAQGEGANVWWETMVYACDVQYVWVCLYCM